MEINSRTIAIVHGTGGSPEGNWFPWLKSELAQLQCNVYVPTMPTPDGQNLKNWLETFRREVPHLTDSSFLIGHSAGATFALRILERAKIPIAAAYIVAGFTGALGLPDYDRLNSSFVAEPFDWKKIKSNCKRIQVWCGDDDPYVPLKQGLEIAENLNVQPTIIEGGGHLNAEFGYTKFPALLEGIKTQIQAL